MRKPKKPLIKAIGALSPKKKSSRHIISLGMCAISVKIK